MKSGIVVEWAPFKLKEGVEEGALLRASETLQVEFLSQQPGFMRRELLRGQDGDWVDLVYWESKSAAEAAVKRAADSQVCYQYFQLMADADHTEPGAGVMHLEQVKVFNG